MPSAILVDDEPNLSQHLQRLLAQLWPALKIVATASNGEQALTLVAQHQPDLLFLDIRMPVLDGIATATRLADDPASMPLIVFTTAYDEYALKAFDTAAVDYLLKPVSRARLQQTVARLQQRLNSLSADSSAATLQALLQELKQEPQAKHLSWLRTGQGDTTELVAVADVVYFKSEHKYTSAFTAQSEHLLRLTLKDLTEQLDPEQFWQVHRSLIVNVTDIASAKRDLRGRYALKLRRRKEVLRTSAAYGHLFKHM